MLLKELTALAGVSGCEDEVRDFILEKIKDVKTDEVICDSMGNIIVHKKGKGPKVMVAAHMDEVGFLISQITNEGYLKFKTVGGIDSAVLVSKRVLIGKDKIPGVLGMKAVHLQQGQARNNKANIKDLYIDIGAKSKEEAEGKVKLGDFAVFDSDYVEFGHGKIKAKALDDRVGCAILLEILKEDYDCDLYVAFTTQEEVGTRGAIIAANRVNADFALVIEGTTCSDIHPAKEHQKVSFHDRGPVITIMDGSAIMDKEVVGRLMDVAKRQDIKYQLKRTTAGGTDAGSIQRSNGGVKVGVIAVPCRYIHSPSSVASKFDISECLRLARAFLKSFN